MWRVTAGQQAPQTVESAEIYLMAVEPAMHRQGIGSALVEALEADLVADGVHLLQVKTLGPSHPDASYEQTRRSTRGWASGRWRKFTTSGPATRA